MEVYCNCLSKGPKPPGGDRTFKSDCMQEKIKDNNPSVWNRSGADVEWQNKTLQRTFTPGGISRSPTEKFSDLEEKVNFLFEIFKSYGSKIANEGNEISIDGGDQIKVPGITLGEIWQLFHLNKRMCAAEEAIHNLTVAMEKVQEKFARKEWQENEDFSGMESRKTDLAQRMALQSRNDLLMSLMKNFLKIGTIDDMYSKLALLPEAELSKSQPVITDSAYKAYADASAVSIQDEDEIIIESLTRLKEQLEDIENVHDQSENADMKTEETETKYTGSKLEVISEQAEIALQEKPETEVKRPKEMTLETFKGEFFRNDGVELSAKTSRLLAQEALLKSSLDKVHYELLSNLEYSEQNYLKSNSLVEDDADFPTSSVVKGSNENETNLEVLSEGGSTSTCEPEKTVKESAKDLPQTSMKYSKLSDFKEAFKNSLLRNTLHKNSLNSIREEEQKSESEKSKSTKRTSNKGSCTVLKCSEKSASRPAHFSPDLSAGRRKTDAAAAAAGAAASYNLRPLTAPNAARKSIVPPTDLRKLSSRNLVKPALLLDKTGKREILNEVKSANKNLLHKKFFVQTS